MQKVVDTPLGRRC